MKIRTGFVSNSSSSSFIILLLEAVPEKMKSLFKEFIYTHFENYYGSRSDDNDLKDIKEEISSVGHAIEHYRDEIYTAMHQKTMPNWAEKQFKNLLEYVASCEEHIREFEDRKKKLLEYKELGVTVLKIDYHHKFVRDFMQYYLENGWIKLLEPSDDGENDFSRD